MKLANGLFGVAAALYGASAFAADLSPGHWPVAERAKVQQREYFYFPPFAGPVDGRSTLVSGTVSPIAVHAGAEALRKGGSAADAAATAALTEIATDFGASVSYAGKMQLIYFEAKTGKVYALDGGWASYAQETDPASIPDTDISLLSGQPPPPGVGVGALGRQTLVPGFMAGIQAMHDRFGRLPFADLFQPAIWYAENGVAISAGRAALFQQRAPQLQRTVKGRAFAFGPDGSLPKPGELRRQPELATTLRGVAAKGAGYMYTGAWARAFVQAVRAEGGQATLEDLARYKAIWREPISTGFGGAEVFGMGDPMAACPTLLALNLLSASGVTAQGPYWQDPKALEAYSRTLRFAVQRSAVKEPLAPDRAAGVGATDCRDRLKPEYAGAVAPKLKTASTAPDATSDHTPASHTMSVVVVDRWGNVAALVHTINTITWGDTGIVVGGVPIADAAAINKWMMQEGFKPGDRVPNDLSPLIALRGGKPVLAIAGIGSSNIQETVRLAGTLLSGSAGLQAAMPAPTLVGNFQPSTDGSHAELVPAGGYSAQVLAALKAAGISVQETPAGRIQTIRGVAAVAIIDQPSGHPHGVEVPQVSGFVESDLQAGVPARKPIALPPEALDRYVGAYRLGPRTVTRIERDRGRLFARTGPTGIKAELFAHSDGRFFEHDYDVQVDFHRDASGVANTAVVRRNGVETTATRLDLAEAARIDSLPPPVPPPPLPSEPAAGVDPAGDWIGDLGPVLPLALHIRRQPEDGAYSATLDSPQSGAIDLQAAVSVRGETLAITLSSIGVTYEAAWRAVDAQWDGRWTQNGASAPLVFHRGILPPREAVGALDGTWDGSGPAAGGPALLLRFRTRAGHGTSGTLDLPDANSRNNYLSHIHRVGDRITMAVETLGGTLEGRLSPDDRTIEGRFTVFGVTTPVTLTRRPST